MKFRQLTDHYLQLAAAGLSILAIFAYDLLPRKHVEFAPFEAGGSVVYDDRLENGNTSAEWFDEERKQRWRCTLREGYLYPFCGIAYDLDWKTEKFVDLQSFDELIIKVLASPQVESLRVYVRNYNPAYSIAESGNTLMFSSVNLTQEDLNKEISFPLENFRVAQWWIERYDVPSAYTRPDFSNVKTLGVDITSPSPFGDHWAEVETFTVTGRAISKESWYLLIALMWVSYFFINGIRRTITVFRRAESDRELISTMSKIQNTLIEKNIEFEKESTIDPLTETYNRRGLLKRLDDLQNGRSPGVQHSVIVADIDHFKAINDAHGHDLGDIIIKAVADICSRGTRGHDSVCRWGGEEFLILCIDCDADHAFIIAEKIRREIEQFEIPDSPEIRVTVSFGVASYNSKQHFDEAFKRADAALLDAKRNGRNQVKNSPK